MGNCAEIGWLNSVSNDLNRIGPFVGQIDIDRICLFGFPNHKDHTEIIRLFSRHIGIFKGQQTRRNSSHRGKPSEQTGLVANVVESACPKNVLARQFKALVGHLQPLQSLFTSFVNGCSQGVVR